MNEMKNHSEVTISDLKQLGRTGNATAHLDTGETLYLKAKHGTVQRKGVLEGKVKLLEVVMPYDKVYRHIRTIQRDHVLIARRIKCLGEPYLQLTGRGYHRQSR
ncbi:hypothetical protein [Streptococcus dentiloxodontae]